jgi:hypothetical protein
MPRLKRTVTPARLTANRRAALLSTGPRTPRGKAWSSLNALRHGGRSKIYDLLYYVLWEADAGEVVSMARSLMTPVQLSHPFVACALNACLGPGDEPIEADPRLDKGDKDDEEDWDQDDEDEEEDDDDDEDDEDEDEGEEEEREFFEIDDRSLRFL